MNEGDPRAVLITGVFGSGKSSVGEEIVDLLEERHRPYALLDLDYLGWFDIGASEDAQDRVKLANVAAVAGNYVEAGVRFFVLAGAIRDESELAALRAALAMPLSVVRLTVSLPEIEKRLRSSATTARLRDDFVEAAAWLAAATGVGIEELAVPNDRPIREVAMAIVDWLGWTVEG